MKKIISSLGSAASLYSRYADRQLLFIFRNSKNDTYEYYEVYFGKRNFMHLAGIKSKTMDAIAFYEACLNGNVTLEDCTPSHDMSTMLAKISVLKTLLDFKNAKLYKIGKKDLVTRVLTSSIMNYCRNPKKIMFVLEKDISVSKYSKIIYEIKKGLIQKEYDNFSTEIKSRIHLDFNC